MGEREYAGPEMLRCFVGKWVGGAKPGTRGIYPNNLGSFLLLNPDFFLVLAPAGQHKNFFCAGFYGLFFSPPTFFFQPSQGDFSGGVFGS